jgi:hypothetical protein
LSDNNDGKNQALVITPKLLWPWLMAGWQKASLGLSPGSSLLDRSMPQFTKIPNHQNIHKKLKNSPISMADTNLMLSVLWHVLA